METSVKVVVPPQPTETPEGEEEASSPLACSSSSSSPSSSEFYDPMEEFSRQLEDIVSTYSSKASVLDKQSAVEAELEKMKEMKEDITAATETEVSLIMTSLKKLPSSEKKLEDVVRKYAELAAQRRVDEKKLCVLQQSLSVLLDERQQLQAESHSSVTARSKLEGLCRELQGHYSRLREQTLKRCREDEEKRKEMTGHFQTMLTEIQSQIELHSTRNEKLCRENTSLTEKLESLMNQCEMREESLENINQRRDLQQKLTEAKLQQANVLLAEAEEKHKREKEYLLREAIEKTKKCFAMKEQELAMKKKLTLYAQKFDEFQETLAKSNEIYVRFKKEMDNMSEKMKKMDKESNLWKTRFENCNKALTDMIQERAEKNQEYDLFVLKITKLEKLCRALQEERAVLYDKIKEVRLANSNLPSKVQSSPNAEETPDSESPEKSTLLTADELEELKQIQKEDPVLTENMSRLKEEQAKLTQFAASLLATPSDNEDEEKEDVDLEEDVVSSAFIQFNTKTQVKEEEVPEQVLEDKPDKVEDVPKTEMLTPEAPKTTTTDTKPEAEKVQTQINDEEEPASTSEPEGVKISPPVDSKPEATEANIKPEIPVEDKMVQPEPEPEPEEPTKSEPSPPSKNTPKASAPSSTESSKKQTPKKKKKRNAKNAS